MKKRMLVLAMVLAMGFAGVTACGSTAQGNTAQSNTAQSNTAQENTDDNELVQIANPWTSYDTLAEAVKASGIDLKLPESIGSFDTVTYQNLEKELIEAIFETSADENASRITVRKSVSGEDNSGDYNEYADVITEKISDVEVTLKGDGEKVSAAVFNKDSADYYVNADEGMSKDDMISLISDIIDKN